MIRIAFVFMLLAGAAQADGFYCHVTSSCWAQFDCEAENLDCYATRICGPVDYVWAFTLEPQEDGSWFATDDHDIAGVVVMQRLGADPIALTLVAPPTEKTTALMLTILPDQRMIINAQSASHGGDTQTVFGICEELK